MNKQITEIVERVRTVVGSEPVPLHGASLNAKDIENVKECMQSGFVSSVGKYVAEFEHKISRYTQARHAVAVVNATSGLSLTLSALGCDCDSDVILSPISFVATLNSIFHVGANAKFVDIEAKTYGLCPEKLRDYLSQNAVIKNGVTKNKETGRRIFGVIGVHVFGHMCRINEIKNVCDEFSIHLIEDAAEALGTFSGKQHAGTVGIAGVVSFNGNKIITTGGGGMILTHNEMLANKLRHLSTTAKIDHPWEYDHDQIGYNLRMPNINAALGVSQLNSLDDRIEQKRLLNQKYVKAFKGCDFATVLSFASTRRSNYWLQALILRSDIIQYRNRLLQELNQVYLGSRALWKPLDQLKLTRTTDTQALPNSDNAYRTIINIPSDTYAK